LEILESNRDTLDKLARTLLEIETLEADEFVALIEGSEPPRSTPEETPEPDKSTPAAGEKANWKPPKSLDLPPAPSPA
jgi:cell division protease FtsH